MTNETWANGLALIYSTWLELKEPSDAIKKQWREWFKPFPDDAFTETCKRICMRGGYRPQNVVGEILTELEQMATDSQMSADEAFNYIETVMDSFWGMGSISMIAVIHHIRWDCREKHRYGPRKVRIDAERLIPLAKQWGIEIHQRANVTATRAQFRRSYNEIQEHQNRKVLPEPEGQKELKDIVTEIIDKVKE